MAVGFENGNIKIFYPNPEKFLNFKSAISPLAQAWLIRAIVQSESIYLVDSFTNMIDILNSRSEEAKKLTRGRCKLKPGDNFLFSIKSKDSKAHLVKYGYLCHSPIIKYQILKNINLLGRDKAMSKTIMVDTTNNLLKEYIIPCLDSIEWLRHGSSQKMNLFKKKLIKASNQNLIDILNAAHKLHIKPLVEAVIDTLREKKENPNISEAIKELDQALQKLIQQSGVTTGLCSLSINVRRKFEALDKVVKATVLKFFLTRSQR